MPRLRRYLPPLLLLLPVIFICGKLLLTPIQRAIAISELKSLNGAISGAPMIDQRGWPWVFAETYQAAYFSSRASELQVLRFSIWRLLADIAILFFALIVSGIFIFRRFWKSARWWQISLRELLALTAFAGLCCGWWAFQHTQGKREQHAIERVRYLQTEQENCAPQWLQRLWPTDDWEMFHRTTSITIDDEVTIESLNLVLPLLDELPFVNRLNVGGSMTPIYAEDDDRTRTTMDLRPSGTALSTTSDQSSLGRVEVTLDLATLKQIQTTLTVWRLGLRRLNLVSCTISDETMDLISQCKSIEQLSLINCGGYTEAGVVKLAKLPRLKRLVLSIDVSDETRSILNQLSLEKLEFDTSQYDTE